MVKTQEMFPSHYLHPTASSDAKTISKKKKRKNSPRKTKLKNCFLVEFSGKVAVPGPILLIALLCVHYKSAEGVSIERPKNAIVIVNHSTFFNCSKSNNKSNEATWYHHPLVGARQDVYDDQKIRAKYKDRFSIDKNIASGAFNLLVLRPEKTDAGRYECVEDPFEKDNGPSAELTVLDSNLVCQSDKDLNEVVGPTECDKPISPDQLQLSCSLTYSGNCAPRMECRKVGSEMQSNETKCGVLGNRVMCNATMEATLNMDGSVYICHIITAEQYNFSLKVNKTIYTFTDNSVRAVTTTEDVLCSANTSMDLPCSYKWYEEDKAEQLGQTLKPIAPGVYRCEAECKIRNETCAFTAMVISASEPWNGKLFGLLVLLVIPLVIVAALVCCIKKKSHGAQPQQPAQQPRTEEMVPLQNLTVNVLQRFNMFDSQDDDVSDYAIRKTFNAKNYIGHGLSGDIYGPGQYNGRQCACEQIMFSISQLTTSNKEEKIRSKGEQWMELDQKNLIKFYDVIVKSQAVFIIMEYAEGGSVRYALKKCTEGLPIEVVKDWATQIATGMEYLHEKDIVHKNLNSVQILIMESFEASDILNKTLKISQFSLNDDNFMSTQAHEKFSFTAPEVFDGIYCKEGDVWSFGVVIWEMLTREQPYKDEIGFHKIANDIREGARRLKIPDWCPEELKELLIDCRCVEPSERPTFIRILERL